MKFLDPLLKDCTRVARRKALREEGPPFPRRLARVRLQAGLSIAALGPHWAPTLALATSRG